MQKFTLIGAATALAVAAIGAQASPLAAPNAMQAAVSSLSATQAVQFAWEGRNYCWYGDGWHGPGFYWCGYAWRKGHGWGGPVGWHGWREHPDEHHGGGMEHDHGGDHPHSGY